MNWLNLLTLFITSVATLLIALYTIAIWRINKRQHKLHYEQELYLHPTQPHPRIVDGKELECDIACILVNPCKLPIVITRIESHLKKNGKEIHFVRGFVHDISWKEAYSIPEERPERIYISTTPWVIENDKFAIFSKKYSGISLEYNGGTFRVEFYYRDYRADKEISKEIEFPLAKIKT